MQSQTQNKRQKLAACGHVSACSQSLPFIMSLRLYSSFITLRPGQQSMTTCEDPERFWRVGFFIIVFFYFNFVLFQLLRGRVSKYQYKRAIIGLQAKRHLNGVSLACRLWPSFECCLSSFVIFQGIRTSIAKKRYMFV